MKLVNYCLLLPAAFGQSVGIYGGVAACTLEAKVCPNGQTVGRTGPNCQFAPCGGGYGGGGTICTADAKICPNGRSVGRTGPNCEFAPCEGSDPYQPAFPSWPSYPTYPIPTNPYPTWPPYPTYPTWPTPPPFPTWPTYPSWPTPTYPGGGGIYMDSCNAHSQCRSDQYCYSCRNCINTPGCPLTNACRNLPSAGECAPIANCERDRDAIDGVCPGSYGGGISPCAAVTCPFPQRCVPAPKYCITTPCPQYSCEGDLSPISPCAAVTCPYGQRCVPEPKQCVTTPCDQFRCEGALTPINPCAAATCPYGQQCVPEPKQCITTPCEQFRCEPMSGGTYNPCLPNPCRANQVCIRNNIFCIKAPCNQYTCIPDIGGVGQRCGVNEEYESCGSSSCWENSCSNSGPWPPQVCTADCRQGCKCKSGFKRGYDGKCTQFCYVLGRPYSSDKGFLVAPVMSTPSIYTTMSSAVPTANASDPLFDNILSEEQRTKVANYWAKVAMMEHASVASFSRFSLELMSVGASTELLALAHQAALDEVRHTQISLDIANQFSSNTFAPGSFPISTKASDFAFGDMEKIATAAALEACIEETLAASVVLYQAEHMGDAKLKSSLRAVALDEANHAAFAWRAVRWMASTSPAVHNAVSAVFTNRARQYESSPESAPVPYLEEFGLLDKGTMAQVQHAAWHQVVAPAAVSLGFLTSEAPSSAFRGSPIADVISGALLSCQQAPVA